MFQGLPRPRRVVITGIGCISPLGKGRDAVWTAMLEGRSGVRCIDTFDVSDSAVKIAAQVTDFDWEAELNPKDRKHVARTVPLLLAGTRMAIGTASGRNCARRRIRTRQTMVAEAVRRAGVAAGRLRRDVRHRRPQ